MKQNVISSLNMTSYNRISSLQTIRRTIDNALSRLVSNMIRSYNLDVHAPEMCNGIKEFTLREGKRIRPILFALSYLGHTDKPAAGFFSTAASLELFHAFILIHDDVIDKSDLRRGRPSLHKLFGAYLKHFDPGPITGEDLSIVAGDLIYSIAIHSFFTVSEKHDRKEAALKKLLETAFYTGSGQFLELVNSVKTISQVSIDQIYTTYDLKTAFYTFAGPLASGAVLAGATGKNVQKLYDCGILLGRAFQIRDDILDVFGNENSTGKSVWVDIAESKKTILLWHAYNHGRSSIKKTISETLARRSITIDETNVFREMLIDCGSLAFAENEIERLIEKASIEKACSGLNKIYRDILVNFTNELLL